MGFFSFILKKIGREGKVEKLMCLEAATPRAEGLPKATHCQLKTWEHHEELHLGIPILLLSLV